MSAVNGYGLDAEGTMECWELRKPECVRAARKDTGLGNCQSLGIGLGELCVSHLRET